MSTVRFLRRLLWVTLTLVSAFASSPGIGQPLPSAPPDAVGLSKSKISLFTGELRRRVEAKELPGAVLMIVRNGKVAAHEAIGFQDREKAIPMRPDSIFRIASMTKPIISVGAMILAEEGKLFLSDPVSKFLPEFKDLQVAVVKSTPDGKSELVLEPVKREMTIQDLLRHTAGLTYGQFDKTPVDEMVLKAGVLNRDQTLAELVTKLSKLPLKHQPGTTWDYSVATDVLARVIEVVSGIAIDDFIRGRVTEPLKMRDTGFWVEGNKLDRMAQPQLNPTTGKPFFDRPVDSKPMLLSGGGGMVSTAQDYSRFCQFLLDAGELDGTRLLSRKSIELMTANHLPEGTLYTDTVRYRWGNLAPRMDSGMGFGLGFAVRLDAGRSSLPGSVGEFWWDGAFGTNFVVDPKERMITILLTQQPTELSHYLALMRQMANAAIVK